MASSQTKKSERSSSSNERSSSSNRIFIDSSVLIAAAISPKGSARDLILASFHNKFEIIISDLVLEETERNLAKKAPKALSALRYFLETLNPKVVSPEKSLILKVAKTVEVKDAPIVAGAISAKADYLASFDHKHLLQHRQEIEINFKVKILTPDELTQEQ